MKDFKKKKIKLTDFQISKMKSARKGFCYDANPSTWDSLADRRQMENLVEQGLMEKLKNHSGDKHGFYSLTNKGKLAVKLILQMSSKNNITELSFKNLL